MEVYLKKGFNDQYLIVKDSIKLMYSFKQQFENCPFFVARFGRKMGRQALE